MARCGERCFSRYVLPLTDERPGLFGRLVGVLVYALFLGLATMAHNGFLLYCYYRFLEIHDEDPVPQAFLDGIPSYVTPAYVIMLIVVLPFILCACCGVGCKVRNLVHWLLALVVGATISSLLTYTAQLILYVIRTVALFQSKKTFLVAVCFCASRGLHNDVTTTLETTQLVPRTTQDVMTSRTMSTPWTSKNDVSWGTRAYVTNDVMGTTDISDDYANVTSISPNDTDYNVDTRADMDVFWCQCNIPFENFPIGVTANDPIADINEEYLRYFGVDVYVGDVDVHILNTTNDVKEAVDAEMKHIKVFLSVLQGVAVILALRLPFWLVLNNLWSHVVMLEKKSKWGLRRIGQSHLTRQPRKRTVGKRMAYFVGRSGTYIQARKPHSRQSSGTYDVTGQSPEDSQGINNQAYDTGIQEGLRRGRQLPEPPRTLVLAMPALFYCVLEIADAFSLLEEIFVRPHYFLENTAFNMVIMVLVGFSLVTTMLVNVLVIVPYVERGKGYYTTEFIFIVLTNIGFLVVRVWLFVLYEAFKVTHVSNVYLLFIIKEFLVFLYCTVNFGLAMKTLKRKDRRRQTADSLGRWRDYTEGLQSDKTDSVWVSMGGVIGETTDTATYTDDSVSRGADSEDLPVYPARNNFGNRDFQDPGEVTESSAPFRRDFRYFFNDNTVQGNSYGTVDLDKLQDNDGGFIGPEVMGGFGTFTRRSQASHRPKNIYAPDMYSSKPPSSPKYTQQELENMKFYI